MNPPLSSEPDESISNRVTHVHHYVLKGGPTFWAECDAVIEPEPRHEAALREHVMGEVVLRRGRLYCGEKLAGDNGPIVGSRARVESAMAQ